MSVFNSYLIFLKIIILPVIGLILIAGCVGGYSEPHSYRRLWENAAIVNATGFEEIRWMRLKVGDNLVLEITDGYEEHDSVFLLLRKAPREGDQLRFTFKDGNLEYDGFSGHEGRNLDTNMPATAELSIGNVSDKQFTADVTVSLYFKSDRGEDRDRSHLFVLKETATFIKKDMKKDPVYEDSAGHR